MKRPIGQKHAVGSIKNPVKVHLACTYGEFSKKLGVPTIKRLISAEKTNKDVFPVRTGNKTVYVSLHPHGYVTPVHEGTTPVNEECFVPHSVFITPFPGSLIHNELHAEGKDRVEKHYIQAKKGAHTIRINAKELDGMVLSSEPELLHLKRRVLKKVRAAAQSQTLPPRRSSRNILK